MTSKWHQRHPLLRNPESWCLNPGWRDPCYPWGWGLLRYILIAQCAIIRRLFKHCSFNSCTITSTQQCRTQFTNQNRKSSPINPFSTMPQKIRSIFGLAYLAYLGVRGLIARISKIYPFSGSGHMDTAADADAEAKRGCGCGCGHAHDDDDSDGERQGRRGLCIIKLGNVYVCVCWPH